jgi:hypothetical protein
LCCRCGIAAAAQSRGNGRLFADHHRRRMQRGFRLPLITRKLDSGSLHRLNNSGIKNAVPKIGTSAGAAEFSLQRSRKTLERC